MARLPALPHVRAGVTQGLSANAAYRQYRAEAEENDLTGMRRQDFLRLYSQTRALRAQGNELLDAPKDVIHGGVTPQPRDTIRAKGYGYWVAVYQRNVGEQDFQSQPFLIKSHQPLTPAEAERRAGEFVANSEFEYDRIILGVGLVGIEEFRPYGG